MKKYVPISKLPKAVMDFYHNPYDREEALMATKNKEPLVNVFLRKGQLYVHALTLEDLRRAIDPGTDDRSYGCTPNLVSFDPEYGVFNFVTRCVDSRNAWDQRVQMTDDWDLVPEEFKEPGMDWHRIVSEFPEVLDLNVRVHCTCPAFLWWGAAYINTQLDTQLVDENRYPGIRDPGLEHTICKHLAAILRSFF